MPVPQQPSHLSPDDPVRQRLVAVEAELAQLHAGLAQLAEPTARRLVQALEAWCAIADDPAHPGRRQARLLLGAYVSAHRRAVAMAGGIEVPNSRGG